jgi:hypothetical protein
MVTTRAAQVQFGVRGLADSAEPVGEGEPDTIDDLVITEHVQKATQSVCRNPIAGFSKVGPGPRAGSLEEVGDV